MSSQLLLLDTHVLVYFVIGTDRLSKRARGAIERASDAGTVRIAAISLWEIAKLAADGRLKLAGGTHRWLEVAIDQLRARVVDINPGIAQMAATLDCHGDPADRLIMASAIDTKSTLVTRDTAVLDFAATAKRKALKVLEG